MDENDQNSLAKVLGEEGTQRFLQQAFEIWINPEIERRRALGELADPFVLQAAQRLQWPDGKITVRLNDELQGLFAVRATRDVEKDDAVFLSDLEHIESFDLIEEELDCGHWTVIWTGKAWFTGFNFLQNRARCADLLNKATHFLEAARAARERGHAAVVVDTLFSACELIAKAELVLHHQLHIDAKTHGAVASMIKRWRQSGNVETAFVDLFNTLGRLRPRYRYDAAVSEAMPVSNDDLGLVDAMINASLSQVSNSARKRLK